MDSAIVVACITGGFSVLGVVISNIVASNKMTAKQDKQAAVMEAKLEMLAEEVRRHNNFAQRVPVLEEQVKVINHRITDLQNGAKN